jgi:hypothetical protein
MIAAAIALVAAAAITTAILLARRTLSYRLARKYGVSRRRAYAYTVRHTVLSFRAALARRRARRHFERLTPAEQLLKRTEALPAPERLPRAPDLSKADQRRQRGRRHPIAHKRQGRRI